MTPGSYCIVQWNGAERLARCMANTSIQVQVEVDGEDEPIWLHHGAVVREVSEEEMRANEGEEATIAELLEQAQACIEAVMVRLAGSESEQ